MHSLFHILQKEITFRVFVESVEISSDLIKVKLLIYSFGRM